MVFDNGDPVGGSMIAAFAELRLAMRDLVAPAAAYLDWLTRRRIAVGLTACVAALAALSVLTQSIKPWEVCVVALLLPRLWVWAW